jgi:hypothetical protein
MTHCSRTTLGLVAAGLALVGVGLVPQLGSAATPKPATHTLKLAAHQTANHSVGKTSFIGADTDRDPRTHAIRGYDAVSGHFNATTAVVKIDVALALKRGTITAHLVGKGPATDLHGMITGGTGKYAGITGTIGTTSKEGSTVTHITLTYKL